MRIYILKARLTLRKWPLLADFSHQIKYPEITAPDTKQTFEARN
jgi:hypothetical protein